MVPRPEEDHFNSASRIFFKKTQDPETSEPLTVGWTRADQPGPERLQTQPTHHTLSPPFLPILAEAFDVEQSVFFFTRCKCFFVFVTHTNNNGPSITRAQLIDRFLKGHFSQRQTELCEMIFFFHSWLFSKVWIQSSMLQDASCGNWELLFLRRGPPQLMVGLCGPGDGFHKRFVSGIRRSLQPKPIYAEGIWTQIKSIIAENTTAFLSNIGA